MTLAPGARVGPYEILSPIGAGGMGEVYRAKDARVDRAVALKVLPEEFFEDEAKGAGDSSARRSYLRASAIRGLPSSTHSRKSPGVTS